MLYELIFYMHDIQSNILPIDNNKIKNIYIYILLQANNNVYCCKIGCSTS